MVCQPAAALFQRTCHKKLYPKCNYSKRNFASGRERSSQWPVGRGPFCLRNGLGKARFMLSEGFMESYFCPSEVAICSFLSFLCSPPLSLCIVGFIGKRSCRSITFSLVLGIYLFLKYLSLLAPPI